MRIRVDKYLFLGPWKNRDEFFRKAQELAAIEFISSFDIRPGEHPEDIEVYKEALRVLRKMPPVEERADLDISSAIVIARQIIERNERIETLEEEARILDKEIARVKIFGRFSSEELREVERESGRHFQFFYTKAGKEIDAIQNSDIVYVGTDNDLDYYVAIETERHSYPGLIEIRIEQSLNELEERLAVIRNEIETNQTRLKSLAHHSHLVHDGFIEALNQYHLISAKDSVLPVLDGEVFAVHAWVPKNKAGEVKKLADEMDIYCEMVEIEPEDRVPTHLENQNVGRLGEDLVGIYDVPSTHDRDPSTWVFFAFALFFSMILGDGGYGFILLLISLYIYYKFGKRKKSAKRFASLAILLSTACLVWGILFTSFFGIAIKPDSPLREVSLITWLVDKKAEYHIKYNDEVYKQWTDKFPQLEYVSNPKQFVQRAASVKDGKTSYDVYNEFVDNILLELALLIGSIHIMISLIRYVDRNWAAIGWVLFIIGCYLYFPSILKATSIIHFAFGVPKVPGAEIGLYLLFGGVALAVILALIQKRLGGMTEIMNVIQIFADGMSYLRLYALGLAGAIMASTFNEMGEGAPFLIGILIIILGHIINLTIGIMGGVIHGLRLNFIEWYHYSFEGGGKRFNPLAFLRRD